MKGLIFGDVTTLPPYINLILRFSGEENLRSNNQYMVP
jgi:hypothetical protein